MLKRTWIVCLSLLGMGLAALGARRASANEGEHVLVLSSQNPVAELSAPELKRLFTGGTKQWSSGAVVQVALVPTQVPETVSLASLLDTTPSELIGRIQQQVFRGEMRRPVVLRSGVQCVAFAGQTPGGICIAPRSAASEAVRAGSVRIVGVR
ncbi:MAG: hypothetical protein RL385_3229 [Pseudomonadota bacterium]